MPLRLRQTRLPMAGCTTDGDGGSGSADGADGTTGGTGPADGGDGDGGDGGTDGPGGRDGDDPTYTYYRDIEPITHKRCRPCHNPEGIGPFPLVTYDQAYEHRDLMAAMVEGRLMPPPPDDRDCQEIVDFRKMPDEERDMLVTWVDQGAQGRSRGCARARAARSQRAR